MPHDTTLIGDDATTDAAASAAPRRPPQPRSGPRPPADRPERPTSRWRVFVTSVLPPILFVVALLVVWQLYVVIAQPRPDIVPGPLDVVAALGDAWESGPPAAGGGRRASSAG